MPDATTATTATGEAVDITPLETAGISIAADETNVGATAESGGPLQLIDVQARRLMADPTANVVLGSELDRVAPLPSDAPPMSFFLAAWISQGGTPASAAALAIIGPQDWTRAPALAYPWAVVAMFVNDIAEHNADASSTSATDQPAPPTDATTSSAHSLLGTGAAAAPALAGVCSSVVNFLSSAFNSLFAALTIPTSADTSPALAFLAFLGNVAIGLAKSTIEGLATRFAKELLRPFTLGVEALGVATLVVSFFTNQTLDVTLDPAISEGVYVFSVAGSAPITGTFVAKAKDLTDDWPATLVDCAKVAGAELPKLIEPGADANWTLANQSTVVVPGPLTTKVGQDLTARLDFTTGTESQEQHDMGAPHTESAIATVTIPRKEINAFIDLVKSQISGAEAALLSSIPAGAERDAASAALKSAVDPTINSLGDAAAKQLGGIFSLTGMASVPVTFHDPPETTTTMPPPQAFQVVMDRPAVAPLLAGRVVDLITCDGPFGHWTGVIRDGGINGSGISEPFHDIPIDFTFADNGTALQATPAMGSTTFDTQIGPVSINLDLQITVDTSQLDASTMSITGTAGANDALVEVGAALGGLASNLPILPAPPGSCP